MTTYSSATPDSDRNITRAVVVVGLTILLYCASRDVLQALTDRACLGAGYTAGRVTWTLGRYCVTRANNSDVVLPLPEARRRTRR